ncbi:hypothetical protein PT2222_40061 [Paraburkholderia tropica]
MKYARLDRATKKRGMRAALFYFGLRAKKLSPGTACLLGVLMRTLRAGLTLLGALDVAALRDAFVALDRDALLLRLAHRVVRRLDDLDHARRRATLAGFARARHVACRARHGAACAGAGQGGLRLGLFRLVDHQQLADVLDGRGVQAVADLFVDRHAFFALVAEHAHLDELVGVEVNLDFLQDGVGQSLGADEHDRFERVSRGTKFGALFGSKSEGGHGMWQTRLK